MDLSLKALEEAVGIRREIDHLQKRLATIFGNSTASTQQSRRKPRMSATARAKIAAAQRARWAKHKGSNPATAPKAKKSGGITPAGRRKLSQMMKARWAAKRRGQAKG